LTQGFGIDTKEFIMFRSLIAIAFAAVATVATAGGASWSVGISGTGYSINTTNSTYSTQFVVPHHPMPQQPSHRDPRFNAPQFDRGHDRGGYEPGRHHSGPDFRHGEHHRPPVYVAPPVRFVPQPVYREYRANRVCEIPSNGGWLVYLTDGFGEMRFSNGYVETCYMNR
jgi:hypothetical protein